MKKFLSKLLALSLLALTVAIPGTVPTAFAATYFNDTFTEAANTALESHTPDTGTSWTKAITTGTCGLRVNATNDTAEEDTTCSLSEGVVYTADATYSDADYFAQVTISTAAESGDDPYYLILRYQDTNNMYATRFNNGNLAIYKKVSGTWTALTTNDTGFTLAVSDVVKFRADGSYLQVFKNGTLSDEAYDGDITSAGKAGYGIGSIGAVSGDDGDAQEVDSFSAQDTDGTTFCSTKAVGTVVDDATVGTYAWSNPSNATSSNDVYATAATSSSSEVTSHYLWSDNLGFALTNVGSILGIIVEVEKKASHDTGTTVYTQDNAVKLVRAGSVEATNKGNTSTNWSTTEGTTTYGGAADLWSASWTESDVENADFGVVLAVDQKGSGISTTASVDYVRITVCYNESAGGGAAPAAAARPATPGDGISYSDSDYAF